MDAAGRAVAVDGQYAGLATRPGLGQCVGQQWQRARLVLDLSHQELDESLLDPQAGLGCRPLDGPPQGDRRHGCDEVQPALHHPGHPGRGGEPADLVRADDGNDTAAGECQHDQLVEEGVDGCAGMSGREELLELVDDQHPGGRGGRDGRDQRGGRVAAGCQHRNGVARRDQGGDQPRTHHRGLAAPRRSGHDEQRGVAQRAEALPHLLVATEEPLRVVPVVDEQAFPRAPVLLRDGLRLRPLQARCVLEDRLLQLGQVPARVETQLLLQRPSGPAHGVQGLGLPTRAGTAPWPAATSGAR